MHLRQILTVRTGVDCEPNGAKPRIEQRAKGDAGVHQTLIVVECKSDNVTIKAEDDAQGEAYTLYTNAPFFVTHNNRETRYWRTKKEFLPGHCEEIENIPHADASDKEIDEAALSHHARNAASV